MRLMQHQVSCSGSRARSAVKDRLRRQQVVFGLCPGLSASVTSHPNRPLRYFRHKHADRSQRLQCRLAAAESHSSSPPKIHIEFATPEAQQKSEALKVTLLQSLQGVDRGIFGLKAELRQKLLAIIQELETLNPVPRPTEQLHVVAGTWRLLYSTIAITGVKKTKLGLREFIKLKDILQIIDITDQTASNEVVFSVSGLGSFSGSFKIKATYAVANAQRVDVKFVESSLSPARLQLLFEKNYQLLLSIFNPEGWLEITYVDQNLRIGRDGKGQVFVLERV